MATQQQDAAQSSTQTTSPVINQPYEAPECRLRQIRSSFSREIDDAKWERMRSTQTLPFGRPPRGGKVAIKVIDQTGVEHMKVIDLE